MNPDQDECVLCCREIKIYAVGACDHPVCYECSARMRVLCETNECPICRSDTPMVVCTLERQPFSKISRLYSIINRKFQIAFENTDIQEAFQLLLENKCKVCVDIFDTFNKLKDHVRREHSIQYCELCAEHLKIFPFERKTYNRKDLARHRRVGDPDDKSHRGHPNCEFCNERYLDNDELYRHLRKEHYFCHFCDIDGKHQYYEDYYYLRVHFRKEHYLCEEGDCANEQFIGAFRTEIDLKAHIAIHHSKNKSKAEARQARMLEFEFTYAHHNRPSANSSPRGNRFNQHKRQNAEENNLRENKSDQRAEAEKIDTQSTLEFPYLSEDGEGNNAVPTTNLNSMTLQSFSRNPVSQRQTNVMSSEDFPALVSTTFSVSSEVTNNQNRKFNFSIHRQNNVPSRAPNVSIHLSQKSSQPKNMESNGREVDNKQKPSWITKKNTTFDDDFPRLETKKPSVTYTNVVNTTVVNNVQSKPPQSIVEVFSNPQSGNKEQFIIIKSKSKKKRHNKAGYGDKTSENKDDTENDASSTSSFLLNNNHFNLLDQDSDDKFKKNLIRPNNNSKNYNEEDAWQQKASFGKDDFPPLAPSEPIRRPPGFSSVSKKAPPPPGFSIDSNTSANSAPLNISLSSIARQIVAPDRNKIVEAKPQHSDGEYKKPYNFASRNESLALKVRELSVFKEFRTLSLQFRTDEITAAIYYSQCLEILGEKDFFEIFPELISLLPDINKQQELLEVHKKYQNKCGAVPKQKLIDNKFFVCDICYQVLMEIDYQDHIFEHETEFSK